MLAILSPAMEPDLTNSISQHEVIRPPILIDLVTANSESILIDLESPESQPSPLASSSSQNPSGLPCRDCQQLLPSTNSLVMSNVESKCSGCRKKLWLPVCRRCQKRYGKWDGTICHYTCGECQRNPLPPWPTCPGPPTNPAPRTPTVSASSSQSQSPTSPPPTPAATARTLTVSSSSSRPPTPSASTISPPASGPKVPIARTPTAAASKSQPIVDPTKRLQLFRMTYQKYTQCLIGLRDTYQQLTQLSGGPFKVVHAMIGQGDWNLISMVGDINQLNATNSLGQTPLHRAIQAKKFGVAQELCARGVNVNRADAKGATPLHYAAAIGNLEVVKLLLDRGDFAQLNAPNSLGQTPLHRAIHAKHFEIANELCARGVNLNCWDYHGSTPLHYAVRVNNLALVTILVEAGAPLHLTSFFGFTVGHQAAYHSDCKILSYFDSIQLDLNRSDNIHQTSPIMVAAFNSNFPGVRFLRERGYPTDGRAHDGTSLGGFALTTKNLALLQYLYQARIPFIVHGLTIPPLDWAINCGADLDFCQRLLDQIDPRTDPLTDCGCWCPDRIGRPHRYEPGTCPVLLSRVLNSRAPLKLEVAQLLVTRGLGYVYHPSPNPL